MNPRSQPRNNGHTGAGGNPAPGSGHSSNGRSGKTRFKGSFHCPICKGTDDDARGEGKRCFGFLSGDGKWAHCTREEFAGRQVVKGGSGTYAHAVKGRCPCGVEHAPADDPKPRRPKAKFERAYLYHDAKGAPVFKVLRYRDPKGFKQCREVDGKTVWNLDGVERIPYRLPELVANPTRQVLIAEGEKDVDALVERGLLATCNSGGALKWRDSYSDHLAGRAVVIIPDNDQVGREHADAVARSLWGKAASIKIVTVPDHKDVSDYFAAGGTVEALKAIVKNSPPWKPPSAPPTANGKPPAVVIPPAPSTVEQEDPINRTDLGNARRLVKRHGDQLRYCPKWGAWFAWDGCRWREDDTGEVYRLAKRTVRQIGAEAAEATDDDEAKALLRWALESESKRRIEAMIGLTWSEPGIPVEPTDLNCNPWLLCVLNGTLDLKTGELLPHRQSDLITKLAPVVFDPAAECPKWLAFLERIMEGNQELIRFLQRAGGYALTGDVSEHALFFLYGTGRNGKGTFLETILALLGDYATTIDTGLITIKHHEDHPTGLTDLDGRRFVSTVEVDDGKRLAEALVKKLTGGDRIKARRMRQDNYEFPPTHKIFLAANHHPEIRGTDEGIWSRVKLIPFNVFIPPEERVRNLCETLVCEEGPGILAWLVRGCLEWQRDGLKEPSEVLVATGNYRTSMDAVEAFIAERCNSFLDHPELKTQAREGKDILYHAYVEWAKLNGCETTLPARKFGSEMEKRGHPLRSSNGRYYRLGLSLKASSSGDEPDPRGHS